MSNKPITMVVTFQARAGKEAELRSILTGLLAPTHKEAGCLNYDLHFDPTDKSKFLFHETWATQAHIEAHGQSPHVQALLKRTDELCSEFKVTYWERMS